MPIVRLGDLITNLQQSNVLGIRDRDSIVRYINRAVEVGSQKANFNVSIGCMDICSDSCGYITLPSEVGSVLAVNVGGQPARFRNDWFEYHLNGPGSLDVGSCVPYFEDKMYTPIFQDLRGYMYLAAIAEDAADNGKQIRVIGETMDSTSNQKQVLQDGAQGALFTLQLGTAACDPGVTQWNRIRDVIKPITQGYVKLIGFSGTQGDPGVTLGYYAPWETNPRYRRIKISEKCQWARVKYRKSDPVLRNDWDVVPIASMEAAISLVRSIRYKDTNNIDLAKAYELDALELLQAIQSAEDGPGTFTIQVDPGYGLGTMDWR